MINFKTAAIGAVLLAVFIAAILFFLTQIEVTKISCQTQYGPCPDHYGEKLSTFLKRPIISITSNEVKKNLSAAGEIGEVRILRHLSGLLEIQVKVSKASIVVQAGDDNSKLWLVTMDGTIVGQTNQSSLPKLIARSGRISPQDQNFVSAVRLVELLARAGKIDDATIINGDLVVATRGTPVIMPLSGRDEQALVGSLQLVLERGTIEGKKPVKIDLRFKNAVVTY